MGQRTVPFSRVVYIEQDDFREDPPKKFFRLAPGKEVRLRYAYIIRCEKVIKDEATGEIQEVRCTYDPETRSGASQASRKVKGTLHWVSAAHAIQTEVRLYDHLFLVPDPGSDKEEKDYRALLNQQSLVRLFHCYVEPSLKNVKTDCPLQFERQGYFCVDRVDSSGDALVFNRTVPLRDSWSKIEKS